MIYKTNIFSPNIINLLKPSPIHKKNYRKSKSHYFQQSLLLTSLFTLSLSSLFPPAYAYTTVVSSSSDTTGGAQTSLRDAILAGNASTDTTINITFNPSIAGSTIVLGSALPMISNYINNGASVSLTNKTWNITGPAGGIIVDGNTNQYRGLFLSPIPDPSILVPATGQPATDIDATTYPHTLSVNLENMTIQNTLAQGGNVSFSGEGGGFGGAGMGPNADGNGFAGGGLGGSNVFSNVVDSGGGGLGGDSNDGDGVSGGVWGGNGNGIGQLQSTFTAPGFAGGVSGGTSSATNGGIGGGGAKSSNTPDSNSNSSNGGFGGGGGQSSNFDTGSPIATVNASNGGFGGGGGLSSNYSDTGETISLANLANGGFGGGGGGVSSSTSIVSGSSTITNSGNAGFGGGGGTANNNSNTAPYNAIDSDITNSCQSGFGGGSGQINNGGGGGAGAGLGGAIFVNSGVALSLNNVILAGNKAIGGNANASGNGGGGGGAGMGGALFIRAGSTLTFGGSFNLHGSQVTAGTSNFNNGSAFGSGIFLQGSSGSTNTNNGITSFATFNPGIGITQTVNDDIADQSGNGGVGSTSGVWAIQKTGLGTLVLRGTNTYSGGTVVTGGQVNFSAAANFGTGHITINGGGLQWAPGNTTDISSHLNAIGIGGASFDTNGNNVSFATTVSGTGSLTKQGLGTATFGGVNTYSGATQINAGTLALATAGSLAASSGVNLTPGATFDVAAGNQTIQNLSGTGGTVNLGASTLTFGTSTSTTFGGLVQGTGGLTKQGSGTVTLSNPNTYSGTTHINAGGLILQNPTAAGSSAITNSSTLGLTFANATFANNLSGTGLTNLSGLNVNLTGTSSNFSGAWVISGTATATNPANVGSASITLPTSASQLTLHPAASGYTFPNVLSGTGVLKATMGHSTDAFNFGPNTGNAFTGTVELDSGSFLLANTNTTPLTHATLQLNTGNTTTVGSGTQDVGNLTMNGGALVFSTSVPADKISPDTISTNVLVLTDGQIHVTVPNASEPPGDWSGPASKNPLLQQDEITLVQLVNATTVSGLASNLTLIDQNGNPITNGENVTLTQDGTPVAVGLYGYGLSTQDNTGLYVSYGLIKLTLQQNQVLLLSGDNGVAAGSELHALLTGPGNVSIDATNTITLNNLNNNYTGTTTVTNDVLFLGTNNALGNTSALNIDAGATTNLNGKTQTIGALNANGPLNIANGNITLNNGGTTAAGTLVGAGSLQLAGGNLAINGANPQLAAATLIDANARATLNDVKGLGSSIISNQGALIFTGATGLFNNEVLGAGAVNLTNNSTISMNGTQAYTGPTTLTSSKLVLNGSLENSPVTVNAGSTLSGNATVFSLDSDGIISPGNSIGIIQSLTNFTAGPNDIYRCEVDAAGNSDLIIVGGTATLNGTLQVVPLAGNYVGDSHTYTILTSGNLITTTFPMVTGLTALLNYKVIYRPNAVLLEVVKQGINLVGFQGNAGRVAVAISKLQNPTGTLQTTLNNFNTLTFTQLNEALNTLDTANNAPLQNSLANNFFDLWGPLVHTLHDPLERSKPHSLFKDLVASVTSSSKSTLAQLFTPTPTRSDVDKRFTALPTPAQLPQYFRSVIGQASFWINNSLKASNQKTYYHPGTIVPEINTTTAGTQVGLDYQLTDDLLVGITTGYAHTSYRLNNNYGRGGVNTYQLGAYGSYHVTPEWYVDALASYGFHHLHGHRIISYPQFTATASQRHHGNQVGGLIETGYDIALPCSFIITPMVNAGLIYMRESGYTETGADTLGLVVKSQSRTYFQGKAGAQLAKFLIEGETQLYGFLKMAYTYRKGLRNADRTTAQFINQPTKFTVFSHNHPDSLTSPGAGFTALFKNDVYITLGYNGDFGKNLRSHEGFLKIGKKF